MYIIAAQIEGISPLLQHRFAPAQLGTMLQGATRNTGSADRSLEWIDGMYTTEDGYLCQPATHLEGAMVKAAATFKIKGGRGKSWRDPIRAYCYISPDFILHQRNGKPVLAPGPELVNKPERGLSVLVMRVIVQRSAVARSRLMIAAGWQLEFTIQVLDDQVRLDVVREILDEAGRAVGIGDYRPRYGRFAVTGFEQNTT